MALSDRLTRIVDLSSKVLAAVAAGACLIMTVHVIADVLARWLFNNPLPGTLEMTQFWWMPVIIFGALAFAEYCNDHLRVTLIVDRFGPGTRRVADVAGIVLSLIVFGIVMNYLALNAMASLSVGEAPGAALFVWLGYAKAFAVLGVAIFMAQLFVSLYRRLRLEAPPIPEEAHIDV